MNQETERLYARLFAYTNAYCEMTATALLLAGEHCRIDAAERIVENKRILQNELDKIDHASGVPEIKIYQEPGSVGCD